MKKILKIYLSLLKKYKKPERFWRKWCKDKKSEKERMEIMIGAILTQRTNWKNVEKGLENLRKEKINSLKDILKIGKKRLQKLIRPSGFYKAKADYLFHLTKFIVKNYGNLKKMKRENLETLRKKLLGLKGIGKETADSILLYALDKPIFVIDEYTRRFVKKYKISNKLSYDFLQNLFQKNLPENVKIYKNFHAFIVEQMKEIY
ncbi:MAG: endonuclease [Candidatus Aenigmatarchaeota archaeon]